MLVATHKMFRFMQILKLTITCSTSSLGPGFAIFSLFLSSSRTDAAKTSSTWENVKSTPTWIIWENTWNKYWELSDLATVPTAEIIQLQLREEDVHECWVGKNVKGCSHSLHEGIISANSHTDWRTSPFRITSIPVRIHAVYTPNMILACYVKWLQI